METTSKPNVLVSRDVFHVRRRHVHVHVTGVTSRNTNTDAGYRANVNDAHVFGAQEDAHGDSRGRFAMDVKLDVHANHAHTLHVQRNVTGDTSENTVNDAESVVNVNVVHVLNVQNVVTGA